MSPRSTSDSVGSIPLSIQSFIPARRFRGLLTLLVILASIAYITLSTPDSDEASGSDTYRYIDVERYKARVKGYIPDIPGAFGLGRTGSGIPCDPNEQPGWLGQKGAWETANPECPGEAYVGDIRNRPAEELWDAYPELRNKSILFAGDSVGRHMFDWFCWMAKSPVTGAAPPGFEKFQYGGSSTCELPALGLKMAQVHTYSLVNTSDPYARDIVEKWFPGGIDWDIQSRIERFFETSLKDFKPDFVQLNSGPWDFRYWYLRDLIEKRRSDNLAVEDRETAAAMAVQTMDYFQRKWPGAKVWFMHPPQADEDDYKAKTVVGNPVLGLKESLPADKYPPLYQYPRMPQYRATMIQRLKEAGHDSLDYGKIQQVIPPARFYKEGDGIHPQEPPKWVMSNMIVNKMIRYARYGV